MTRPIPTADPTIAATDRYRRRTPATNTIRNTDPARITVVPRSGCSMTRPQHRMPTGSSGTVRCPTSSSRPHLRARAAAANTTSASFANSEGWIVTGPSWNHLDDPYASIPAPGRRTTTSITSVPASSGVASRRHAG
jgi:hypothetical protein